MVDYKMVDGDRIRLTDDEQAAHDAAISSWPAISAQNSLVSSAASALTKSDETMLRIAEAVSLGLTTWRAADVVLWVQYRKSLRSIVGIKAGSIPDKPSYPANT